MGWRLTVTVALFTFSGTVLLVRHVTAADRDDPDDAAPGITRTTEPTPSPAPGGMPGVTPGEAALAPLTVGEVARRCQLRWDQAREHLGARPLPIKGLLPPPPPDTTFNAGESIIVAARPITADTMLQVPLAEQFTCTIPGDLQPSPADLAAATSDRVSVGTDALLKRCSTALWHDISDWTMVASSVAGVTAGAFVAVSPSGRYTALCKVAGQELQRALLPADIAQIVPAQPAPVSFREPHNGIFQTYFSYERNTCANSRLPCIGQLFFEIYRVPRTVAKVRLESLRGGSDRTVQGHHRAAGRRPQLVVRGHRRLAGRRLGGRPPDALRARPADGLRRAGTGARVDVRPADEGRDLRAAVTAGERGDALPMAGRGLRAG